MGSIKSYIATLLRIEKINQALIDARVDERVRIALGESEALRQEQDRLKDQEFQRKISDMIRTHETSFENYKSETERLINSFKNQILMEKKEVFKERETVMAMQKKTSLMENRFNHYILRFKEILFLNKKLVENIQTIVKAESQIEDLLYEIDHIGPEKFTEMPEVVIDDKFLDEINKKEEEIQDNIVKFRNKVANKKK
ncbi:hypothetical protein [Leptospira sp. GIMC2001]|uniref:hypothetical protein n=1 Tax=Leptospira sp. GIMC2001 TaxID=1513297 RepID=UPI00234A0601|nr:hypothetical protein [Leptospira sp. GIMC2001]WCL47550.1 hypothetical protein O4O04_00870 [Leptospira sp. GIMC2001]